MLTESEAETRWCPFVRYLATFRKDGRLECSGGYNRGAEDTGLHTARCIASQCMAWRWHYRDEIHVPEGMAIPAGYYAFATMTSASGGNVTKFNVCRLERREHDGKVQPQRGYCGMASRPE